MPSSVIIVLVVIVAGLFVEALIFAPEKMPWNRRKRK